MKYLSNQEPITWGTVTRGTYHAMLWFTLLIGRVYPYWLNHYIALLVFLGVALKPLLEKTGLHRLALWLIHSIDNKRRQKTVEQHKVMIKRQERDNRYKRRRVRDPKLPKHW